MNAGTLCDLPDSKKTMTTTARLIHSTRQAIPGETPGPVAFAEREIKLPRSSIGENFDCGATPWLREPLESAADPLVRRVSFPKPIQAGGSTLGEIMLCYWILYGRGMLMFNWEHNEKAAKRWKERLWPLLMMCDRVARMIEGLERTQKGICELNFGKLSVRVQGALTSSNLDSETVRYLINEEIHNWEPGHLMKAYDRKAMVWDWHGLDISNAGMKGDQFHEAWLESTQQRWAVECPGCSNRAHEANRVWHVLRTRWDEKRPELGGLRYDAEGCRLGDGRYQYTKLARTVRYQMPCGYEVRDDFRERRKLSGTGRYLGPGNESADGSHRGYTLEAVSVDRIAWIDLIKEKHIGLRARRFGDMEPWKNYVQKRECGFFSTEDMPVQGTLAISSGRTKNREGLQDREMRLFALDFQHGEAEKNELPHWWGVIRDVDAGSNSLLCYEGKIETDVDVIGVLDSHGCQRWSGCADVGHDYHRVMAFCYRHGINAVKGGKSAFYYHDVLDDKGKKIDQTKHIYSEPKAIHAMLKQPPLYDYTRDAKGVLRPDRREPMFWFYSRIGIADLLHWIRAAQDIRHEVPEDVSQDYREHQESQSRTTNGETVKWINVRERDDLLICERYIAMLMQMDGRVGAPEKESL